MTEVTVDRLAFDKKANAPVVVLKDLESDRVLPIWIGPGEATAIAMQLSGIAFPRPLTHDLLIALVSGLGGVLQRVLITRVQDSTYFAELIIARDGSLISVDARPSDSIAMALRSDARIFADDVLLVSPARPGAPGGNPSPSGGRSAEDDDDDTVLRAESLEERLRAMRPEDLGRFDH